MGDAVGLVVGEGDEALALGNCVSEVGAGGVVAGGVVAAHVCVPAELEAAGAEGGVWVGEAAEGGVVAGVRDVMSSW